MKSAASTQPSAEKVTTSSTVGWFYYEKICYQQTLSIIKHTEEQYILHSLEGRDNSRKQNKPHVNLSWATDVPKYSQPALQSETRRCSPCGSYGSNSAGRSSVKKGSQHRDRSIRPLGNGGASPRAALGCPGILLLTHQVRGELGLNLPPVAPALSPSLLQVLAAEVQGDVGVCPAPTSPTRSPKATCECSPTEERSEGGQHSSLDLFLSFRLGGIRGLPAKRWGAACPNEVLPPGVTGWGAGWIRSVGVASLLLC